MPFKVGDRFQSIIDILEIIEFVVDKSGEPYVKIKNIQKDTINRLPQDFVTRRINDGFWVKVEDEILETLPFKVGDAFKVSKTQLIFKIEEIKDDNVFIVYEDGLTAITSINAFENGLKSGYYVPSTTFNNYPTTSATPTTSTSKTMSGDANNKQFLKKQKDIKKLEKEIDGLEALDDEFLDDDTKAYIIEKKKELEALKR